MARLAIHLIKLDMTLQPRAEIRSDWTTEYADQMRAGSSFPPVVVWHDGEYYWLADGFHRVRAAQAVGQDVIDADIHEGTKREAQLFSLSANAEHGHRRTNDTNGGRLTSC